MHDHADVALKDRKAENCLTMELGLSVARFGYNDDWLAVCRANEFIFGKVDEV
jgi:hypothetical protein